MCRTQCVLALATLYVGLVHSWDIAVSLGDQLQFYKDGTKTDTVHLKNHNLTKITYDEVINMMLFIDKQRDYDAICGYNLSFKNVKCFVKRYGSNIVDLAFDPPTNKVFFTDTKDKSINWISLNYFESKSNEHGNLLINMVDRTPTEIEVDSCNGFIYWTNSKRRHYGYNMERARLNGSEIHVVEKITPVNNFAIDLQTHQNFFFTGSDYDLLKKEDLSVKNRRSETVYIYYNSTRSCQDLTVSKDYLYWTQSSASDITIWQKLKNSTKIKFDSKVMYRFHTTHKLSIAANYRIKDQIHGLQDCDALKSVIPIEITTQGYWSAGGAETFRSIPEQDWSTESTDTEPTEQTSELYETAETHKAARSNKPVIINENGEIDCTIEPNQTPKTEIHACHGYCLNNGNCSLNKKSEPVCHCKGDYVGDRCEVSGCLNYCFQGSCSLSDEGHPKCRCNAGYSGARCEVYSCQSFCLNSGVCSLNKQEKPVCRCVGNHEGTRCEAVKTNTFSFTPQTYSANKNLTLTDLLSNWRKPAVKVSVFVEV